MTDLGALRDGMREFTRQRGWEGYHDPKSLILALVGEVGELSELFQWLPAAQAVEAASTDPMRAQVSDEIADVLLYLVRLADVLDIDLAEASSSKLERSAQKYAVGLSPDHYRQQPTEGSTPNQL